MSGEPVESKVSKKELNKLARKEGKSANKQDDNASTFVVQFSKTAAPELVRAVELFSNKTNIFRYTASKAANAHLPVLVNIASNNGSISGDANIARFALRSVPELGNLYGNGDAWLSSQIDEWLEIYSKPVSANEFLTLLDKHLADKTYLVGEQVTVADLAILILLSKLKLVLSASFPNASRWFDLTSSSVTLPISIPISFVAGVSNAPATGAPAAAAAAGGKKAVNTTTTAATNDNIAVDEGGTCPPLFEAIDGQVCTRFPPEPSGYLHIGHAKAVLLNQYYAQRYHGRLLVRFDDTNPSKEKEEFEENIMFDLVTLGVKADSVSHSSDHFAKLEEIARRMLSEGKAYMDDTDQETMQAERMERKESKHRNSSVADNLAIFEKLLKGEPSAQTFCMRAKIDMSSVNGTMRDPVLYRYNATPHHRTGTKFKAYPTYDFACPIIDSVEGVTHALRTTEYNDRDEQYYWIQDALGLRKTHIQSFGKMNFIHTVLSKRKLTWFVDNKLVEGWFDPRFPTIQGCVRRGMNVDALKNFIISQGASRRIITMEWDKFWSENKKVLEEKAPRYMGVTTTDKVELILTNVEDKITAHTVQIIPNKPEFGTRVMRRYNKVLLDQIDAATYKQGEEITLLRWGNVKIDEIVREGDAADGKVLSIKGTYDALATNFSKTKKATWIAAVPDLVPCQVFEFDHLISKAKLNEEDKFQDFLTPVTKMESAALADPCLRTVQAGEVIQLERKGFFRCDKPYGGSADKPCVLFAIPDGKVKATAISTTAAAAANKEGGKSKSKK